SHGMFPTDRNPLPSRQTLSRTRQSLGRFRRSAVGCVPNGLGGGIDGRTRIPRVGSTSRWKRELFQGRVSFVESSDGGELTRTPLLSALQEQPASKETTRSRHPESPKPIVVIRFFFMGEP